MARRSIGYATQYGIDFLKQIVDDKEQTDSLNAIAFTCGAHCRNRDWLNFSENTEGDVGYPRANVC
jgi:hypothetical protein